MCVCVFSLFFHVGKQEEEHTRHHARVARLHKLQQLTITHVGERWVDSGGESWAELSALKMKRIESTQGEILVNGCSQTKR